MGDREETTSWTPSSPPTVTIEATTSLSHVLYIELRTRYTQLTTSFSLSHIYTHMTFGLIYTYGPPRDSQEHMHASVLFRPVGEVTFGPLIIRFSRPIRRDLFPNKLPLHSGMGYRASPIRFRHASTLSGISTLVNMSDLFSTV